MKKIKRKSVLIVILCTIVFGIGGIVMVLYKDFYGMGQREDVVDTTQSDGERTAIAITPVTQITELEDGLSTVRYDQDYQFDAFIAQGGATSDYQVIEFLNDQIFSGNVDLAFRSQNYGCSTVAVRGENGFLFGRNFDWEASQAMIVVSNPDTAYASISTVNMDFISSGGIDLYSLPVNVRSIAALYAPLDGMNEEGLAVSVNMIQDSASIEQNTTKPDLTTSTAIRLLLNEAKDVEEAIALLNQYDLHASMNMMIHFAISDAQGNSVVIEYINNEMVVTPTPVVTNFYLSQGDKYGIGSSQSHERYQIISDSLMQKETMTSQEVMDVLDSVSKDNFGEFESTEWSIVFDQNTGEVNYVHREKYDTIYQFKVPMKGE